MEIYNRDSIKGIIGTEVGVSAWLTITQDMVNPFAALTGDPVEIHTNVELAHQTPHGGTIAHGLFTLAPHRRLLPSGTRDDGRCDNGPQQWLEQSTVHRAGEDRFAAARPLFLRSMEETKPGQWVSTFDVTIEIEGEEKPALIAEWLGMQFTN